MVQEVYKVLLFRCDGITFMKVEHWIPLVKAEQDL